MGNGIMCNHNQILICRECDAINAALASHASLLIELTSKIYALQSRILALEMDKK